MTSSISTLPTNIPWRRICVSGDMLDPEPCDLVPPRRRSSIAVSRHDPPDESQPLPHSRVSYLKVCVMLDPFAPELEVKLGRRAADIRDEMVRSTTSPARVPVGARRYEETDAFARRVAAVLPPVEAPMISRHVVGTTPSDDTVVDTVDALTLLHAPIATTARRMGVTEAHARQLRLRAIEARAVDKEG